MVLRPEPGFGGSGMSVHRAGWVVSTPWHIIENGYIRVKEGRILDVAAGKPTDTNPLDIIDHGPGVLMPGLINAHVHLELTALKGKLNPAMGFRPWVRELLKKREAAGAEALNRGAQKGADQLLDSGTICAGEISTLGITRNIFESSALFGVWFREWIGSGEALTMDDPANSPLCKRDDKNSCHQSLAGHAPHTTSPGLLKRLKRDAALNSLPFSIHLAESEDETRFITTAAGPWADFLKERDIDVSSWPVPCKSPVAYLKKIGLLDAGTMAVHLLSVDGADLESVLDSGTKTVLCPRSNHLLHGQLPDLKTMLAMGLKPALGTDSLASNNSLSLFDEMAFVLEHYPGVDPGRILAMATLYGAGALGMADHLGSLEPGKLGDCLYLPLTAANAKILLERIIHHDP